MCLAFLSENLALLQGTQLQFLKENQTKTTQKHECGNSIVAIQIIAKAN